MALKSTLLNSDIGPFCTVPGVAVAVAIVVVIAVAVMALIRLATGVRRWIVAICDASVSVF